MKKAIENALSFVSEENTSPDLYPILVTLCLVLVLVSAFWPFQDMLGYYFTDNDTPFLLRSSIVQSTSDLVSIFTTTLHPDRPGSPNLYYRPLQSLSFSINYALFGFDPFGYHLTNLLAHLLAAGMLFVFVFCFHERDLLAATFAGLLYTFHPLLMDTLPTLGGRKEIMVGVFLMVSLLAFNRHQRRGKGGGTMAIALTGFLVALGFKELGIIVVPLVMLHLFLWPSNQATELRGRMSHAARRSVPFLAAGGLYFAWWCYVTRARAFIGGQGDFQRILRMPILKDGFGTTLRSLMSRLNRYPMRYLEHVFEPLNVLNVGLQDMTDPALLTLLGVLILYGIRSTRILWTSESENPFRKTLLNLGMVSLGSLILLPVLAPFIKTMVASLYGWEMTEYLPGVMASRDKFPVGHYQAEYLQFMARIALYGTLTTGGVLAVADCIRGPNPGSDRKNLLGFSTLKCLIFYLGWLLIPGIFFAIVDGGIGPNNMYIGILPLAALLGTIMSDSLRILGGGVVRAGRRGSFSSGGTQGDHHGQTASGLVLLVAAFLGGWQLAGASPLLNNYLGWKVPFTHYRTYMNKLDTQLAKLPPQSRVDLLKVPRPGTPDHEYPHVGYWRKNPNFRYLLTMKYGDRDFRVNKTWNYIKWHKIKSDPLSLTIRLRTKQLGSHHFQIEAQTTLPES